MGKKKKEEEDKEVVECTEEREREGPSELPVHKEAF